MSWAEVKKINSDMNMPLDSLIKSQRAYGASDAPLIVFLSDTQEVSASGSNLLLGRFKPSVNGSVRIIAELRGSHKDGVLRVLNSNSEIIYTVNPSDTSSYVSTKGDMPIVANETYRIYLYPSSAKAKCRGLKIGASVIDASMIEYSSEV